MYIDERFKSPEKKSLAEARNHIKKTIIMIYNQLLQELFPSFLPAKLDRF
jgi:CRISPR/Cas system CMR-associated protein Cmr5 small subunit